MSFKLKEQWLRDLFSTCADVQLQMYKYGTKPNVESVMFLYCTGLADSAQINQVVLPLIEQNKAMLLLPVSMEGSQKTIEVQIVTKVFAGELLLFFENTRELFSLNISKLPQRQPEESTYEVSVKGPRDAFTESVETNIALIRKRVRSTKLCNESYVLGKTSQTKVSLLYLSDVINMDILEEARRRLNSLDVDIVNGISPMEELLADSPFTIMPLINYITRPDYVVESLQRGRFCILIDGASAGLIAPVNLQYLFKSPEDSYMPYSFVALERLMRYFGFLVAGLLPGFYIALVSFHTEQIPFTLLATISLNSYGIPLSPTAELIIMLVLYELFREAGVRLPKPVGQTVTVVGGLIVGDAVIRAGIVSANIIVIVAITLMAQYILINQSLSSAVIFMRLFVVILTSILGFLGFILATFSILLYLSTLKSFGIPYLTELHNPFDIDLIKSYLTIPKVFQRTPPKFLRTKTTHKKEEDTE